MTVETIAAANSVIKATNSFVKAAQSLSNIISANQENSLRFECTNGLGIHTTHVFVEGHFNKWYNSLINGKLRFSAENIHDIRTVTYSPTPQIIKNNYVIDGNEVILDLKPLMNTNNYFTIEVAHKIEQDILKNLVRTRAPPESVEEKIQYKLSAQLRSPELLQRAFSNIDIEDFPITARVHLNEKINSKVPDYIKRLISLESEVFNDRDPHNIKKYYELNREKSKLLRNIGNSTLEEKIADLSHLLTDNNFVKYISIHDDFLFDKCEKGSEFFKALGVFQLPKYMNITSLTDLSLKKPAATGKLIYDSKKFESDIQNLF